MTERDDILRVLEAARTLIEDEANWTKGATARDARGNKYPASSVWACYWCAFGAIHRAIGELGLSDHLMWPVLGHIKNVNNLDKIGVAMWNDSSTHDEVIAGFDAAIADLKEAGQS